jgi:hypothetical protein
VFSANGALPSSGATPQVLTAKKTSALKARITNVMSHDLSTHQFSIYFPRGDVPGLD